MDYVLPWQSSSVAGTETLIPGATDIPAPTFIPRYLEGQSAVNIQHVACGDFHTACLTGKDNNYYGKLMTWNLLNKILEIGLEICFIMLPL